jgi:DNA-binding XRE family transcriptional regulator
LVTSRITWAAGRRAGGLGKSLRGVDMPEGRPKNNVRQFREDLLLSKAELARRAGVSVLTVDRVERGESCRLDTKRKIILALGLKVEDKQRVFTDARRRATRGDR